MAEGMMNPNGQDELMLVQSFEQLANAVGAEVPVSIQSEIAAVKAGNRMSSELQKILAEGSMQLMNQLNPETINSYQVDGGTERMSPEMMDSLIRSGQVTPDEMSSYQVDGQTERLAPSQMGGITSRPMPQAPSGAPTVPMPTTQGGPMNMQDMINAGIIKPERPKARPAPMRPQMRPSNLGGR
jgi:hypothetical protein